MRFIRNVLESKHYYFRTTVDPSKCSVLKVRESACGKGYQLGFASDCFEIDAKLVRPAGTF